MPARSNNRVRNGYDWRISKFILVPFLTSNFFGYASLSRPVKKNRPSSQQAIASTPLQWRAQTSHGYDAVKKADAALALPARRTRDELSGPLDLAVFLL